MAGPAPAQGRIHVVGAGLAGLACAVQLARLGRKVSLYEASPQAGGRCRSYFDETLGRVIDNGNHIFLSGNWETIAYLAEIDAEEQVIRAKDARLPFLDLESGEAWRIGPSRLPLPFWLLDPSSRVPGESLLAHFRLSRLAWAKTGDTVAECLGGESAMTRRLWRPLSRAIMNAEPEEASARLLWRTLWHSWLKGARACHPMLAKDSLSATFVDPALDLLKRRNVRILFGHRLSDIVIRNDRIRDLRFGDATIELANADILILAVPPNSAAALLPQISPPLDSRPIVNAHIRLPEIAGSAARRLPGGGRFLGLVGGTADWIFLRGSVASLTRSAATELVDLDRDTLAQLFWSDAARVLDLPSGSPPPVRIVKERRATFAQTPQSLSARPGTKTPCQNLFLAGDWLDTGWPATIEGAITSGRAAAWAAANANR